MKESHCKNCMHHKKNGVCDLKSHYPDTFGEFAKGGLAVVREGYAHAKLVTCKDYAKKEKK